LKLGITYEKAVCVKTSIPDLHEFTLILLSWTRIGIGYTDHRIGIGNTDPDPDA
jgi:hypothetical protein